LRDAANRPLRILEQQPTAGTWSLQRDYIYAAGRLVASVGTEGPRHYHLDHLGSIRLETDTAGQVVKQRNFLPFGQELPTPGLTENDLRFTGHERDDVVTGSSGDELDYMHARFCSPTTGRFLSLDPVLGRVGAPQSWNRYAYVMNDPVNLIDPTGEFSAGLANTMSRTISSLPVYYRMMGPAPDLWAWARNMYQDRFEEMAVEGNYLAAFIDYLGIAVVIPPPPDPDPFAVMGAPLVPLGRLGRGPLALQKQLASEAQMAEVVAGGSRIIAGAGARKSIDDINRLVTQYGGKSNDWSKISSSTFTAADGARFEIHAYKNSATGAVVELKTKFK
jgi:RHS repeat-associated protein